MLRTISTPWHFEGRVLLTYDVEERSGMFVFVFEINQTKRCYVRTQTRICDKKAVGTRSSTQCCQDISVYNQNIELIKPWLNEKTFQEMQEATSHHERFAMLIVALNTIADQYSENIWESHTGLLFDVIKARSDQFKEAKIFAFKRLSVLLERNPNWIFEHLNFLLSPPKPDYVSMIAIMWFKTLDAKSKNIVISVMSCGNRGLQHPCESGV